MAEQTFLHVGCGLKSKPHTPFCNTSWKEVRLDIDSSVQPDVTGTMVDLSQLGDNSVDAIFSSHNIEHLYPHEVTIALNGFSRVLKDDGFILLTCPDLQSICKLVSEDKLADPAYISGMGPITPLDMIYGHRASMKSGNLYMAHRCGFTKKVLTATFKNCGFSSAVMSRPSSFDLWAVASTVDDSKFLLDIATQYFPKD